MADKLKLVEWFPPNYKGDYNIEIGFERPESWKFNDRCVGQSILKGCLEISNDITLEDLMDRGLFERIRKRIKGDVVKPDRAEIVCQIADEKYTSIYYYDSKKLQILDSDRNIIKSINADVDFDELTFIEKFKLLSQSQKEAIRKLIDALSKTDNQ